MGRLIDALAPLPATARRSLTLERGLAFVSGREPGAGLGARAGFCDPQAPRQKGAIETTHGRLRRPLPRDADGPAIPEPALGAPPAPPRRDPPRKRPRWRTPRPRPSQTPS